MTAKTLRASHGVRLIETELLGGEPPKVIGRQYTVKVIWRPKPQYQGPDLAAAEKAFDHAVHAASG